MAVRRLDEQRVDEEILPQVEEVEQVRQGAQGDQVPIGGQGNEVPVVPPDITNGDIRDALLAISRALTTHVNMGIAPRVNIVERTMTSILRYFLRMKPPIFLGSKVGVDPQEFLDGVYRC